MNKSLRNKLIVLILILAGALSLWLAFKLEKAIKTESIIIKTTPVPSASVKPTPLALQGVPLEPKAPPTVSPTPSPSSKPTSTSSPEVHTASKIQVNLSINGQGFDLSLEPGKNQCEVLSEALAQGKIQSLNMKYDENLKSYAIYQINEIGKENSVWWVYEVNGQSPSQGCSYIKANNGDQIKWRYIGS